MMNGIRMGSALVSDVSTRTLGTVWQRAQSDLVARGSN